MENKKHVVTLYIIIWLLVIALGVCTYTHSTTGNISNWMFGPWDWTMRKFWSWWSRMWEKMWSGIINNFSSEQKTIIDELKKARESWDKNKERELMDALRNSSNRSNKK